MPRAKTFRSVAYRSNVSVGPKSITVTPPYSLRGNSQSPVTQAGWSRPAVRQPLLAGSRSGTLGTAPALQARVGCSSGSVMEMGGACSGMTNEARTGFAPSAGRRGSGGCGKSRLRCIGQDPWDVPPMRQVPNVFQPLNRRARVTANACTSREIWRVRWPRPGRPWLFDRVRNISVI